MVSSPSEAAAVSTTAKEQGKDKFGHGSCDHKAILHAVSAQDVSLVHAQQE